MIDGIFDSKSVGSWSDLAARSDNEEDIYETISLADDANIDDGHPNPEPGTVTTLTTGQFFQYDVHREDTLQGICVRWSVSMRDLRKLNIGLTKDSDLRSCTVLNIPVLGPEDKVRRQAQSLVLSFPGSGLTDEKARYYLKAAGYSYEMALAIASDEIKAEKETEAAQVCCVPCDVSMQREALATNAPNALTPQRAWHGADRTSHQPTNLRSRKFCRLRTA